MKGMNNKRWKIKPLSGTRYEVTFKVDGDYFRAGTALVDAADRRGSESELEQFTTCGWADVIFKTIVAHWEAKNPGVSRLR